MSDLRGIFRAPFPEQVAAFRLRLGNLVPTATWRDLWKEQHDRAFVVAGAMKADLLEDLAQAVDRSISEGQSLEAFRADFRGIVERRGWHGWTGEGTKAGQAWRTRVIYRTNMRTSYAAGRMAQLRAAGFPYFVYRHGGSLEPRLQHLGWDGLVLPSDHPFWDTHAPPNGWGCSCYILGARSLAAARRLGGDTSKVLPDDWRALDPRTGEPAGIDKGWGYAPGASVSEEVARIVAEKAARLPAVLAGPLVSTPPPPPPPPPVPVARKPSDAPRILVALGLSRREVAFPRGSSLEGINDVIRVLAELELRFDLPPMQAVGSGAAVAKMTRDLRHSPKASAWYSPHYNSMGWNRIGLSKEPWNPPEVTARLQAERDAIHRARLARLPEGPAKDVASRVLWPWTVVEGGPDYPRSVAIHETGHRIHFADWDTVTRAADGWQAGWQYAVSQYGATNVKEFVAESFVLYMLGEEQHWRIKPELLAVFMAKDRRNAR